MKRLTSLILCVVALAGCSASSPKYARQTTISFVDFRPYAAEGFFFSADPYPGAYTSVGQIRIEVIPERSAQGTEEITAETLLDIAYTEAREMGANGISNFKIDKDVAVLNTTELNTNAGKFRDSIYPANKQRQTTSPLYILTGTLIDIH